MVNKYFNPNPNALNVGDCAIRALCRATDKDWDTVFWGVCIVANMMGNMPSANVSWGAYLRKNGFVRHPIPDDLDGYTVRKFCEDHPKGTYVLACDGHVVTAKNGEYYDTYDSGDKTPLFYWERKEG